VIVCNTLYNFFNEIKKEIGVPIINLKNEVKKVLFNLNIKKVGVIGTPLTITRNLYNFNGIDCIVPSSSELNIISDAIQKMENCFFGK